jgi:hypothetical protein
LGPDPLVGERALPPLGYLVNWKSAVCVVVPSPKLRVIVLQELA